MTAGHMEDMTEPIIRGWMEGAHNGLPAQNWTKPSGVQTLPAYVATNGIGSGAVFPTPRTDLYPANYKPRSGASSSATIDKVSGKLATDCTPSLARDTITNGNANSFSVDQFVKNGGGASLPTDNDDVHTCGDVQPSVSITLPAGNSCLGTCQISVTPIAGTHALSSDSFPGTLVVTIDGQQLTYNVSNSGQPVIINYTSTGPGSVTVTASLTDSVLYQASDSKTLTTL
jgi:hypothetical protein